LVKPSLLHKLNSMPFFSRRSAPVDGNTTTATAPREKGWGSFRNGIMSGHNSSRHGHNHNHNHQSEVWSRRPTFGQWLKGTWVDILTMAIMGAIGLGVRFHFFEFSR
jgi:diacylglycerol diphosphate phosphatase / phosphatidate phosphatase